MCAAPRGNQFWKIRTKHGRGKLFSDPEILWEECCNYFQWVDKHPLKKAELIKYKGTSRLRMIPAMRAMTISGLCIYLNLSQSAFYEYRKNEDFMDIITRVEEIIKTQKFEGAAAELLNPNIIARDLGLADKKEHSGGITVSPKNFNDFYSEE